MKTILLIDDDESFLISHRAIFESNNYKVETANNGDDGIAKIKASQPDLVVLDVMMTYNYEGFDVAKKIREELGLIKLPIIMLTSIRHDMKLDYKFAPDKDYLPVDVFIEKPANIDNLVRTVKDLLMDLKEEPGSRL
ncbi:MAG: response regulator [Spirochaetes bacterium]|nr:response regulator [Spirochaetota bacterium]